MYFGGNSGGNCRGGLGIVHEEGEEVNWSEGACRIRVILQKLLIFVLMPTV